MKPYVQHQAVVNLLLNASEEEEAESLSSSEVIEGGSKVIREQINLEPSLSEGGPEKEDLRKIGSEFEDVFSDCPGNMRVIEHDIELSGEESIRSKPYRCSPVQRRKCEPLLVPHRYRRLKVAGY
uniref:Putative tick transposon n=1 Tax=Rhipicephalus microplus TaxID=6941 RepID=A0A6G5AIK0_RHIMP